VLYTVLQKKSREESSGSGSGVEILVNEPYSDGPGGAGQYTQKIYHIGSHLPGTERWNSLYLLTGFLQCNAEVFQCFDTGVGRVIRPVKTV